MLGWEGKRQVMSSRPSLLALSVVLMVSALACGEEKKFHAAPVMPMLEPTSETIITSAPIPPTSPVSPSISVSDELARACHLDLGNIAEAPKFYSDKSEVLPADYAVLDRIAACTTTGPLTGRGLTLIGRADPRGPSEYNMALGARRAHAVGVYLDRLGVESGRVHEMSRGELDECTINGTL